jgi:hypothetical protein
MFDSVCSPCQVSYGPCPASSRSMYPRTAQGLREHKYKPSIRFDTPDASPLMPCRLQALALHQRYSLSTPMDQSLASSHSQPSIRTAASHRSTTTGRTPQGTRGGSLGLSDSVSLGSVSFSEARAENSDCDSFVEDGCVMSKYVYCYLV